MAVVSWRRGIRAGSLAALLAACTTLPPQPEERLRSTHVVPADSTALGGASRVAQAGRADMSGVRLLDTGMDAFLERAALIEAAEVAIDAQYYIWNSDVTGRHLAERLYAAAERGVRVRLLLDDVNVAGRDAIIAALDSHPRLEVRIYNPFPERRGVRKAFGLVREFARLNRRMHNKSFTVDGAVTIIGGRNIGDEYFDAGPELNFRDRDVVAIGPVVDGVGTMFDAFWNSELTYPVTALSSTRLASDEAERRLAEARGAADELRALGFAVPPDREAALAWLASSRAAMTWAPARLVHDDPPSGDAIADHGTVQPTARALVDLAAAATSDVLIESAYLVMDDATLAGVERIRARGVPVRALTNSLASNDVPANHAAYARRRAAMLRAGVALHELRPDAPSCARLVRIVGCTADRIIGLHAKSFVFDRRVVYVGSLNLNLRSAYLNAESAMIVESELLAAELARSIEENLAAENSWRVTLDERGRVRWHDAAGATIGHEPETSWWLRTKTALIAMLPLEKYL